MADLICWVEGCNRPVRYKQSGLCGLHYQRLRKHGDVMATKPPHGLPEEEAFWIRVDKNGPIPAHQPGLGHCWSWVGAKNPAGYGTLGRRGLAHRWAYKRLVAPIPQGLEPDHLCRNPGCVNPFHLEWVTHLENIRRGESPWAVNRRKTHCSKGHEYTPENTRVNKQGWRSCRTCHRDDQRERGRRKRASRDGRPDKGRK